MVLKFDFDASLLAFVKAENSAFSLSLPEGSVGANFASGTAVSLAPSGFLARAEFETIADVSGREFSIGIDAVTLAERYHVERRTFNSTCDHVQCHASYRRRRKRSSLT